MLDRAGEEPAADPTTVDVGCEPEVLDLDVAAAVEEQTSATQEISRNVADTSRGTEEVSTKIETVNRVSQEVSTSSKSVLDTAGSLHEQSDILQKQVDQFVQNIRAS